MGAVDFSYGKIYKCLGYAKKKDGSIDRNKLVMQWIEAVVDYIVTPETDSPFNTEYPINRSKMYSTQVYFDDLIAFKGEHKLKTFEI